MTDTSAPYMIFFSGSSAVGKTTALDYIEEHDKRFVRVPMTARAERAKLGNPSWDSLLADKILATEHQIALFMGFKTIIEQAAENHDGRHQVFERALIDVSGYSYAFGCEPEFYLMQTALAELNAKILVKLGRPVLIVHFPIWPDYPYARDEFRPSQEVRDKCAEHLNIVLSQNSMVYSVPLMSRGDSQVTQEMFLAMLQDKMGLGE